VRINGGGGRIRVTVVCWQGICCAASVAASWHGTRMTVVTVVGGVCLAVGSCNCIVGIGDAIGLLSALWLLVANLWIFFVSSSRSSLGEGWRKYFGCPRVMVVEVCCFLVSGDISVWLLQRSFVICVFLFSMMRQWVSSNEEPDCIIIIVSVTFFQWVCWLEWGVWG